MPQTIVSSTEPWAFALRDHLISGRSATCRLLRDDGFNHRISTSEGFDSTPRFQRVDSAVFELSRGRVLDVGAGAGKHALVLQSLGLDVCAIDISPTCVEILTRRGVRTAICSDIFEFEGGPFDTVLFLGHGVGVARTLGNLRQLLTDKLPRLVAPGGQLLVDSLDARLWERERAHRRYAERNRLRGAYVGEWLVRLSYKQWLGELFSWLYLDFETLSSSAEALGWECEKVIEEQTSDYLAQLHRKA